MTRPLAWLLLAVLAIGAVGLRASWLGQDDLEREWSEVVGWARLPATTDPADMRLIDLARDWDTANIDELALAEREGGNLPRVARADIFPEAMPLLARFEALLADEHVVVHQPGIDPPIIALLSLGKLALQTEDLDAERMGQILRWTRTLQHEGFLLTFMVGTAVADEALERCLADNTLIPEELPAAPEADEFFSALCRDYVLMQRDVIQGPSKATLNAEFLEYSRESNAFLEHATKRAFTNVIHRLHPLRNDPAKISSLPPIEPPGELKLWLAASFHFPSIVSRSLESRMTPPLAANGAYWMRFVAKWRQLEGR